MELPANMSGDVDIWPQCHIVARLEEVLVMDSSPNTTKHASNNAGTSTLCMYSRCCIVGQCRIVALLFNLAVMN